MMLPFAPFVMVQPSSGAAYTIARSLRFNSGDSANLTRTFGSPTSQNVFTFSCWVKRTILGAAKNIFGVSTNYNLSFNSSDQILVTIAGSAAATSSAVFRDPSAWYHVVYVQNGTAVTIYVNGVSVASGTATNSQFNTAAAHQIGSANSANYYDGYLAEIYFIDGTALTPSDFAQTSTVSGQWVPKQPTGLTYGANGFWLSLANNASTTTVAYDDAGGLAGSGAGANDWTANNLSVATTAAGDSVTDTPTCNYPTMAHVLPTQATAISDGGLKLVGAVDGYATAPWGMPSGKWYWEQTTTTAGAISTCGISSLALGASGGGAYVGSDATTWGYANSGNKVNNASPVAYGSTYTTGDVVGIAFDADNGKLYFSKNGTWQASGDPAAGTNAAYTGLTSGPYFPAVGARATTSASTATVNFGQQPFSYSVPSGFSALCSANLATPAIPKPTAAFDIDLFTGTGAARSKTGLAFQPDLVWIKGRSGATSHGIYDSTRGAQKDWGSDLVTDETTQAQGVTAFNADGYSTGTLAKLNTNAATYAAWLWKEGITQGMDVVTYVGNGSNRTISHNLGVVPRFIIIKSLDGAASDNIAVYHANLTSNVYRIRLNTTDAQDSQATFWNSTTPTSSVFSLGTNIAINANTKNFVAYVFAEVPGFSAFRSYAGNSAANGTFVYLGFKPKFVLVKRATTAGNNWRIWDGARSPTNLATAKANLYPNAASAEDSTDGIVDFLSNGFKMRENLAAINTSGDTMIFAAFAEAPLKYATAR